MAFSTTVQNFNSLIKFLFLFEDDYFQQPNSNTIVNPEWILKIEIDGYFFYKFRVNSWKHHRKKNYMPFYSMVSNNSNGLNKRDGLAISENK